MNWLVIFDNLNGKYPNKRFRAMLYNFIIFLNEKVESSIILFSENKFKNISLIRDSENKNVEIKESEFKSKPFDGVILSLTGNTIDNLINNTRTREDFFRFLKLLKANGKLIINCGEGGIKNVRESNLLEGYKFIYQQKVGINWFNFHLKNTFLKNL